MLSPPHVPQPQIDPTPRRPRHSSTNGIHHISADALSNKSISSLSFVHAYLIRTLALSLFLRVYTRTAMEETPLAVWEAAAHPADPSLSRTHSIHRSEPHHRPDTRALHTHTL